MQEDFHYYATYCASYISGYSHEESLDIAYSAQFVDQCSRTLLAKIKAPSDAATTQLQLGRGSSSFPLFQLSKQKCPKSPTTAKRKLSPGLLKRVAPL